MQGATPDELMDDGVGVGKARMLYVVVNVV